MPIQTPENDRALAILAMGEQLARAATPPDVHAALVAHVPALVGAAALHVFERRQQTRDAFLFVPAPGGGDGRAFSAVWPGTTGGCLRHEDGEAGSMYEALFVACGSPAALCHTPLGTGGVLVATFTDASSLPGEGGWRVVQGIAAQAAAALERVSALQRLHELRLEDPDTGLGNRRMVEVVLRHSFAQATRGEPLSLVGIRSHSEGAPPRRRDDGQDGEDASDTRVHQRVADLLRTHARGSDTLARFDDDDVFIVVLRASTSAGAEAFLRRVLEAAGEASLSCVVTEYDARFETPQAMLDDVVTRVHLARAG
jgi:GGDEF domain-containing protein